MNTGLSVSACALFVSAVPHPSLVVSAGGRIVAANTSAKSLFSQTMVDQHLTFALRTPAILDALQSVLRSGAPENVQATSHGAISRALNVHISRLGPSAEGEQLAFIHIEDTTRALRVERMRSDFVANASHELRTPLTAVAGFIDTLLMPQTIEPAAQKQFLKLMKAQTDRMARLVGDLLSLSSVEINEHVPPTTSVDLVQITQTCLSLLRPLIVETDSTITLDLNQSLKVRGDESQLSQVVSNLVENALKYSGPKAIIKISSLIENNVAALTVSDNGPGIDPQHLPRLTERFYRVNLENSRNRGGTGLGLAICKHILNRHHGKLSIESIVGEGSKFTARLPLIVSDRISETSPS